MEAWNKFLTILEEKLGVETIKKWLRPLRVERFDARNLYLVAENRFQIAWFEEHIREEAKAFLLNPNKKPIQVHLSLSQTELSLNSKNHSTLQEGGHSSARQRNLKQTFAAQQNRFHIAFEPLNHAYSWASWISKQSHFVSIKLLTQVMEERKKPETASYNPIYLYGVSGTGKTHLLVAAAHEWQKAQIKVVYAHADTFTEHVVSAIQAGEMSHFRDSYRNTDVIIIDDVHLFAKKWATQEELFHTFNTLHIAGKQIILSANCPPSQLQFIEPRLVSRFEWGIVLPLELLSRDEMRQMIQNRAKSSNFLLNQKVVEFLLDMFKKTKSLCRAFEALMLRTHLNQQQVRYSSTQLTVAAVQQLLNDLILEEQKQALTAPRIVSHVAEFFGIKAEDILGKAQSRDCVLPRQIAMYLCRHELKMPFTKIGDFFSKDHSTVMSSVKVIEKGLSRQDEEVDGPFQVILQKIRH